VVQVLGLLSEDGGQSLTYRQETRQSQQLPRPLPGQSGTPQLLHRNVQRFRGGLVCKALRLVYHSTLGSRVIKKKKTGPGTAFGGWSGGGGQSSDPRKVGGGKSFEMAKVDGSAAKTSSPFAYCVAAGKEEGGVEECYRFSI